jgi:two-component system phosphate regulon response regulator PhoB
MISCRWDLKLGLPHRVIADGEQVPGLTEFRLLHFLITHTSGSIRAHSSSTRWGDHVFVEERTVDVHIRRLRKALEPSRQDRLIQTVRGAGYRLSAN